MKYLSDSAFNWIQLLVIHPTSLFELRRDKKDKVNIALLFTLRRLQR